MAADSPPHIRGLCSGIIQGPPRSPNPRRKAVPLTSEGPLCASLHFGANELERTQLPLVSGMGKLRQGELTRLAQSHTPKADLLPFGLHPTFYLKHSEDRRVERYWSPEETPLPGGPHLASRCQPAGGGPAAGGSGPRRSGAAAPAAPQTAGRQKTRVSEGWHWPSCRGIGNLAMKYLGQNP